MNPVRNTTGVVRTRDLDTGLRGYMQRVFGLMAAATALTGLIAYFTAQSPELMELIHATNAKWFILFGALGVALVMGFGITRMPAALAHLLFWTYAALIGLALSAIFTLYTGDSITLVFFIAASMFSGMAIYGLTTKRDLTSWGSFLIMGLWGLIIAGLANWWLQSPGLHWGLSIVGVFVFTGLTAYDAQKIQAMYNAGDSSETGSKKAIFGAFMLYLDFVNLFLRLLQLFGARK